MPKRNGTGPPPKHGPRREWILFTGQPGCGKTTAVKAVVEALEARGRTCRGFYTDEVLDPSTGKRTGFDAVRVPRGERGVLARTAATFRPGAGPKQRQHKTGKYLVDVESFEAVALPGLDRARAKPAPGQTQAPSSSSGKKRARDSESNPHPPLPSGTGCENDNGKNGKENTDENDSDTILVLDEIGRMELHSAAFQARVRELLDGPGKNRLIGAITAPIYGHRVPFCDEVAAEDGVEVHKLTKKTREKILEEVLRSIDRKGW